ncbi:hypothetical protein AB1Y20_018219 [Prymnesium parvum]|uniref:Sulfotransferase domain-containing protein n=1 Tax=Prymnesium parvum TaxID=97485 RepID=A0AB34JRM3_PRYPA
MAVGEATRVVITAPGRSGSTLLQSAFIASCDAITFFEPCLHSPLGDVRREQCAEQIVRFLMCKLPAKHGHWDRPPMRRWLQTPYLHVKSCPSIPPFDSVEEATAWCEQSRHVVVKEIRVIGQLSKLVSRLQPIASPSDPIAIIQLVRDPRATLASQRRLLWHGLRGANAHQSNEILRRVAKRTCGGMLADSRKGSMLHRRHGFVFMRVRYEDLIANFTRVVDTLYHRMGWQISFSTHERLKMVALGRCDKSVEVTRQQIDYSICRDISAAQNSTGLKKNWTTALTRREQGIIHKVCAPAMHHFGYLH